MHEDEGVAVFHRVEMDVDDAGLFVWQAGQLEIVGGEQGKGPHLLRQMHRAGPGQRQAVEGAGTAPDLVDQHQAVRCRVVQDIGGLAHLHHESRAAGRQIVGSADASENPVDRPNHCLLGGDEAAKMCQQRDQRGLAHVSGFAAEIGAGDDQHSPLLGFELQIVGYEQLV